MHQSESVLSFTISWAKESVAHDGARGGLMGGRSSTWSWSCSPSDLSLEGMLRSAEGLMLAEGLVLSASSLSGGWRGKAEEEAVGGLLFWFPDLWMLIVSVYRGDT